ncbi:hypothetical protein YC2023_104356 [Brassica napus]
MVVTYDGPIDYRPQFVWGDLEDCPVPKRYDALRVHAAAVAGLKLLGLHATAIPFVSADPEFVGHNAADKKFKKLMHIWIEDWAHRGKSHTFMLIITSDSGFQNMIRKCNKVGLMAGLIYNPLNATHDHETFAHFYQAKHVRFNSGGGFKSFIWFTSIGKSFSGP